MSLDWLRIGGDELAVLSFDVPSSEALAALSPSERAVAALVAVGKANAEIARMRSCSIRTVENQLNAVYRKLGIHSRSELVSKLIDREGAP